MSREQQTWGKPFYFLRGSDNGCELLEGRDSFLQDRPLGNGWEPDLGNMQLRFNFRMLWVLKFDADRAKRSASTEIVDVRINPLPDRPTPIPPFH